VLIDGRERICIRLKDGTPMYIPRRWTDADGPLTPGDAVASVFTVDSLRQIEALVDALLQRH